MKTSQPWTNGSQNLGKDVETTWKDALVTAKQRSSRQSCDDSSLFPLITPYAICYLF